MTTLVTGATGFVGSHVARQLVGAGHSVRVLVRPEQQFAVARRIFLPNASTVICGMQVRLNARMSGVRRVFHVAADYRLWAQNPAEIYESNVEGTRRFFEIAAREGASSASFIRAPWPRLRFRSIEARMRCRTKKPRATLDEMIGHYKRSKFLAEARSDEGCGGGRSGSDRESHHARWAGDWKPTPTGRIIVDFLNGKMPAYVDTGLNVADVEDVAAGHLLAAERGRIGERYILGGRNMTLKQILDALSAITGRPAPRVRLPHVVALAAGYADECFSPAGRPRTADSGGRRKDVASPHVCGERQGGKGIGLSRWTGGSRSGARGALVRIIWLCGRRGSRAQDRGASAGSLGFRT